MTTTRLSVNINKFATLRNARGGNNPDVLQVALDCQTFGADGITVHPRPDERHIRYEDVLLIKNNLQIELNIEGNPKEQKFVDLVLQTKPTQVTLVPDSIGQLTSNHGWDTVAHHSFLKDILLEFRSAGIRTSIFVDADEKMIEGAAKTGTDRIELYTEHYAKNYANAPQEAIANYATCATIASNLQLGINAGHDLDLKNLQFFANAIPNLAEVSIGHALVCDALYLGLHNTIQLYKRQLIKI
jgi:pyridoxine 5-phosphate synthase